jgi:hypothetical protein
MTSKLENFVSNRLQYLDLLVRSQGASCTPDTPKYQELVLGTVSDISKMYASTKNVTCDEALRLDKLLESSKLKGDHQNNCCNLLHTKSTTDAASGGKQVFMHYDKYLTESLQTLYATVGNIDLKNRETALHLVKLRATRLSEKSWAHCIAVMLSSEDMDGPEKLTHLEDLKETVRNAADPNIHGPLEYGSDVKAFLQEHHDIALIAFSGKEPAESKWDHVTRRIHNHSTPCRGSNKLVANCGTTKGVPKACMPLVQALQCMQNQGAIVSPPLKRDRSSEDLLKNLRIFAPGASNAPKVCNEDEISPLQMRQQLLALGWTPPSVSESSSPPSSSPPPQATAKPEDSQLVRKRDAIGSDIDAITKRIQEKVAMGHLGHGVGGGREDGEEPEENDDAPCPKKRPAANLKATPKAKSDKSTSPSAKSKSPSAKSTSPSAKSTRPSAKSTKPKRTKTVNEAQISKVLAKVKTALPFIKKKWSSPFPTDHHLQGP